ncbi:hypothetical protein [Terasakiella pusilla]|uniref:hypothetical protein n=1 Tax=Terasakiella pusilla TaxID=64973 RepID=UPI003AA8FB9D
MKTLLQNKDVRFTRKRALRLFKAMLACLEFIDRSEYLQNAYLWTNPGKAGSTDHYSMHKVLDLREFGVFIDAKISVRNSRNNVYVKKDVTVNGDRKDIRALKKITSEITEALDRKGFFYVKDNNFSEILEMPFQKLKQTKFGIASQNVAKRFLQNKEISLIKRSFVLISAGFKMSETDFYSDFIASASEKEKASVILLKEKLVEGD